MTKTWPVEARSLLNLGKNRRKKFVSFHSTIRTDLLRASVGQRRFSPRNMGMDPVIPVQSNPNFFCFCRRDQCRLARDSSGALSRVCFCHTFDDCRALTCCAAIFPTNHEALHGKPTAKFETAAKTRLPTILCRICRVRTNGSKPSNNTLRFSCDRSTAATTFLNWSRIL